MRKTRPLFRVLGIIISLALITVSIPPMSAKADIFTTEPMASAGGSHTVALKADGTVWVWGNISTSNVPVQVTALSNVIQISAGRSLFLALKSDGTVWTCEYSQNSQSVQVSDLRNITQISAGESHYLALRSDKTVWAWGENYYGQLGNNSTTNQNTPVQVVNDESGSAGTFLTEVVQISAGANHSMVLKNDGTASGWGYDRYGSIGRGSQTEKRKTPVRVRNAEGLSGTYFTDIKQISAGRSFTIILRNDGTVFACGENGNNKLGIGSSSYYNRPTVVKTNTNENLTGIKQVSAGSNHLFAQKNDSTLFAWGQNASGQLGDGTTTLRANPVSVMITSTEVLDSIKQISAGDNHSVALRNDNTVLAWGANSVGQLGTGTVSGSIAYPVPTKSANGTAILDLNFEISITPDRLTLAQGTSKTLQASYKSNNTLLNNVTWNSINPAIATIDNKGLVSARSIGNTTITASIPGSNAFEICQVEVTSAGQPDISQLQVSAGVFHAMALKPDGTVWAWGQNSNGQLGDGTKTGDGSVTASPTLRSNPVQVSGLTRISKIEAGYYHSMALINDGKVMAWGYNAYGELGDNSTTERLTPVEVADLTGVIQIDTGVYHSLALKSDGTVWAWGRNNYNQLGNGNTTSYSKPQKISALSNIVQISVGYYHNMALDSSGKVWTWGYNDKGQIGDGTSSTTVFQATPQNISALNNQKIVQIGAGGYFSAALTDTGNVYAWGDNTYGQIGNGSTISTGILTPTQVPSAKLNDVKEIEVGKFHTLARKNDGSVWGYGLSNQGQLGTITASITSPTVIPLLQAAQQISAGYRCTLYTKNDNTIWGIGDNNYRQLGNNTVTNSATPLQILLGEVNQIDPNSQNAKIASGLYHNLVLKEDGTVWSWGLNDLGQLGNGTSGTGADINSPVQVIGLNQVKEVAANNYTSMALKEDGTIWAWGYNSKGQLGDGSTTSKNTPVKVKDLTNIVQIKAGYQHGLALKSDGSVWAWGYNNNGELGDGTTADKLVPQQVPGLTGIIQISAGASYNVALKNDGTVYTWGDNTYGQIGDGTVADRTSPYQIPAGTLSNVSQISAGVCHFIALKNNGDVYGCGRNANNEIGLGNTTADQKVPVLISGVKQVKQIGTSAYHSMAIKQDGSFWGWGYNGYGHVGTGSAIPSKITLPTEITAITSVYQMTGGYRHTLIQKNDGTIYTVGNNHKGQLGNGLTADANTLIPVKVELNLSRLNPPVSNLAQGSYLHHLIIKPDGTVIGWGDNQYGQLGDGTYEGETGQGSTKLRKTPVEVQGLTNVKQVAVGYYSSYALTHDGSVWAWGSNSAYQLGDGTTNNRNTPAQITALSDIVQIVSGHSFALALKKDGTIYAWGNNSYGQLGQGNTTTAKTPITITSLSDKKIIQISTGNYHSLALTQDGKIYGWGFNDVGQVGKGTTSTAESTPALIGGTTLNNVVQIVAVFKQSFALQADGKAYAWGYNHAGRLGIGNVTGEAVSTPTPVVNLSGIQKLAVGSSHGFAHLSGGNIWGWGYNAFGQLGTGSTGSSQATPIQITPLKGAREVAVGYYVTIIAKEDNTFWAVGDNTYSQLGAHGDIKSVVPVSILDSSSTQLAAGQEYYYALEVKNITAFNANGYRLSYDSNAIEIIDIASQTYPLNISLSPTPVIKDTDIQIISIVPGEIRFKITSSIPNGQNLSGVLTIIKFKAKKAVDRAQLNLMLTEI